MAGRPPIKAMFENGTYDMQEFHDVFIECEDTTEYEPALKLVGSWQEWEKIKRNHAEFRANLEDWHEELKVKLRSRSIRKIQELAEGDNAAALNAAKWIAEEGAYGKKRGRPTKSQKQKVYEEMANETAETKAEKARIISILNGGKAVSS